MMTSYVICFIDIVLILTFWTLEGCTAFEPSVGAQAMLPIAWPVLRLLPVVRACLDAAPCHDAHVM